MCLVGFLFRDLNFQVSLFALVTKNFHEIIEMLIDLFSILGQTNCFIVLLQIIIIIKAHSLTHLNTSSLVKVLKKWNWEVLTMMLQLLFLDMPMMMSITCLIKEERYNVNFKLYQVLGNIHEINGVYR